MTRQSHFFATLRLATLVAGISLRLGLGLNLASRNSQEPVHRFSGEEFEAIAALSEKPSGGDILAAAKKHKHEHEASEHKASEQKASEHEHHKASEHKVSMPSGGGDKSLVLMHIPFNFGHTIEKAALFGERYPILEVYSKYMHFPEGGFGLAQHDISWEDVSKVQQKGGEPWGHFHPDLRVISKKTGCPMYFTPQKHWPTNLATKYFGNKTVFGMLRDPYERLVAMWRGGMKGYGVSKGSKRLSDTFLCDVNRGVKMMLKEYIAAGSTHGDCTMLPQAEYFEGPHAITLPVDNRKFPTSMNEVFRKHKYDNYHITTNNIFHVTDCENVWAKDLDAETRALVRQVYARDFKLLCKHFEYCNIEENTCIPEVPQMCPKQVLEKMGRYDLERKGGLR